MALTEKQQLFYMNALSQYKTRLIATLLGIPFREAGELIQEGWKSVNDTMSSEQTRLGNKAFWEQQNDIFNKATKKAATEAAGKVKGVQPTGKELFDQAVEYIESQGFEYGDMSIYSLPNWSMDNSGHIGLHCWADQVGIIVYSNSFGRESSVLRVGGDFERIREILDVLIFTIKLGVEE